MQKKKCKKKTDFFHLFSPKTYFFQNVHNNSYFHSEMIFTHFWTLLDLKMHFENFLSAVIPLEAETLNASTAFLKHFFKRWHWKIHKNWKWSTCPILSFWNNIEMFETCFSLQSAFWKFLACSNLFRSPNFKRLYSLFEALFQKLAMKNLQKLKMSYMSHTLLLKQYWDVCDLF